MFPIAKTHGPYSVHPGVAQVQKWIEELPVKTGRSLGEWIALTQKSGPPTEKERRDWLKKEHKLGTNSAAWIAERADGKGTEEDSPDAYLKTAAEWVEAQYSGQRAALRPFLPVQDDGAALSQSRIRADQAIDEYAHRSRIGAGQHENAQALD